MVKFPLCCGCAARFSRTAAISKPKDDSECYICKGLLSRLPSLLQQALSQSNDFEWGTFSLSSSFPKAALVREQDLLDWCSPGDFISIKNMTNRSLMDGITKATGKKNDQRSADAVFEIDFSKNISRAFPAPVFIHGHYLKFSRKHCQSRWHCSRCKGRGCDSCGGSGSNYPSIEEELGKVFIPAFLAKECTLHASGREDVDVRTLGTGRPFIMALSHPKKRKADMKNLEKQFENNESVRVLGLRMVGKGFVDLVCDSHFEKEYSALVSADRQLTAEDAEKIKELEGKEISQQTPTRVLSRRTDMLRTRKIHRISASLEAGGRLRLTILAEAGTYIKELIHSDVGRTTPSISALLGCNAKCDELDVVGIRDFFLETAAD